MELEITTHTHHRGGLLGGLQRKCNWKSPLSENFGIDFYSGLRKKFQVYTFIVASREKKHKGGCNSKSYEIQV